MKKNIKIIGGSAAVVLAVAALITACGGGTSSDSNGETAKLLVSSGSTKINVTASDVTASSVDAANIPANAIDNNLNTHWTGGAVSGNQWIQFKLNGCYVVDYAKLAWYNGNARKYNFTISASADNGATWTAVKTATTDGTSSALVVVDFADTSANVMRLESTGSDVSTKVSVNEVEFWSPKAGTCTGTGTTTSSSGASTTVTTATTTSTTGSGGGISPTDVRNAISQQRMSDFVKELASSKYGGRLPGTTGDTLSRDYVVAKFQDAGLQPAVNGSYLQPFSTKITSLGSGDGPGNTAATNNIIGYFPGNDPVLKKEFIVISGHRDHLGTTGGSMWPGANDDLSGTAATTELAYAFAKLKTKNKRTIVFIAFSAEEQENMGSMYLAKNPISMMANKNIVFMTSIDMIGLGYDSWSSFSQATLDGYVNTWFSNVYNGTFSDKDSYSHEYKNKSASTYDYDAGAFAAAGVNNRVFGLYNNIPTYHEPTDTWDSVHFAPMTVVTKTIFDFLWKLDQDPTVRVP